MTSSRFRVSYCDWNDVVSRFEYLDSSKKKNKKGKKAKHTKASPQPDGRRKEDASDRAEAVYLRKSTIRAAWREYREDGGESLSELVEDLLLKWLRERA